MPQFILTETGVILNVAEITSVRHDRRQGYDGKPDWTWVAHTRDGESHELPGGIEGPSLFETIVPAAPDSHLHVLVYFDDDGTFEHSRRQIVAWAVGEYRIITPIPANGERGPDRERAVVVPRA
jgi:hypothetical protein